MRFALIWFALATASPAITLGQGPSGDRVKKELAALYQSWLDGLRARDTVALGKLITDDYLFTVSNDSVVSMNRAERMASIATDADSLSSLVLEQCDINLYRTAATGVCRIRERNVTAQRWEAIYSTVTFVRGADRTWRIGMVHASVIRLKGSG